MWLTHYLKSSVGRKQLMGLTGLLWYLFLAIHLIGNIALLQGREHFNDYAGLLLHSPMAKIVVPSEFLFLGSLLIHIYLAITLYFENWRARPEAYKYKASAGKGKGKPMGSSTASRTMIFGGIAMALFVVGHVAAFKFGYTAIVTEPYRFNGQNIPDLYARVLAFFNSPILTGGYIVAFLCIFLHLWHGVQSSMQSAGLNHPKYTLAIKAFSRGYAVLVAGGFIALAIWAHLN
jgi:succinate dehydrogenase / fumarate reductase cytochrome b subunit